MKTSRSYIVYYLGKLAKYATKIPGTRFLLSKPYDWVLNKVNGKDKAKQQFKKYGIDVIDLFDKCLTDNGVKYMLAFGSCLGAVREKGFIKHDDDLDVWIWIDDYKPSIQTCLEKCGFKLVYRFLLDNGNEGREETYECKGVQIDVFYLYPEDGMGVSHIFNYFPDTKNRIESVKKHGGLLPTKCILPISRDIIRVPFENLMLPIPTNAHQVMECRYGKDYMTPQQGWSKAREDKYHVIMYDKIATYEEYE